MDERPLTLELIEARHNFPGPYTFKVIGEANAELPARVAECVRATLGLDAPPDVSIKTAKGGRHESVTIEPTCPDAEAVLKLYASLRELSGVRFLL